MFRSYRDTVRTPVKTSKEAAKKYYCDLCDDDHQDRVWESELDVEIHRRRVHNEELIQLMKEPKNYMCSVCLRKQSDKATLIAHIKTDHLLSSPDAPRGITLAPEIQICVLCRTLCETEEQMLHHIYGDHSPMNTVEIKRHVCACGEEFFNRVLLKHHIFMMKGNHQACDGTEMTVIMTHPETNFQDPVYNPEPEAIFAHNTDEGTAGFFVNIKENENTSHPNMLPNEVDHNTSSDITLKSLGNISPQMSTESRFNVNDQISEQDIGKQTEHKIDLQLLHDLNDPQEINIPSEDNIHIQTNNETNKIVIQTYNHTDTQLNNNDNNLVEMDIDPEPDRLIIDSDNDIYNDQIILNANEYNFQSPNKSKEITIGTSNIRIQLVDVDDTSSHNQIPRLKKKPSNQNIILLNNTLPKKYGSSKHFYEQIVHSSDEISASEGSGQYRYVLDPAGGQMEFIEESSPNEEVYEVVELPGDPNEERIVVEEALLFS
ncbi:unnamed protein product [Arctia plantaginis]|uniref:C2H2-type domain-containing protein n=1 Tax=Arctia plantaginis TaxID=874455 RepID=A0A8S0ZYS4_ARCPL|nr:unnamed protein product [Arctia plantaginis]